MLLHGSPAGASLLLSSFPGLLAFARPRKAQQPDVLRPGRSHLDAHRQGQLRNTELLHWMQFGQQAAHRYLATLLHGEISLNVFLFACLDQKRMAFCTDSGMKW